MNQAKVVPLNSAAHPHVLVRDGSADLEIVQVFGDLDLACADELESLLHGLATQPHAPAIAVNLTACHYLDSTILTVFVRASRELGDRFALIVPKGSSTHRILQIVGLDKVLHIDETPEALAESFGVTLPVT